VVKYQPIIRWLKVLIDINIAQRIVKGKAINQV
jgi:hypothetical protein